MPNSHSPFELCLLLIQADLMSDTLKTASSAVNVTYVRELLNAHADIKTTDPIDKTPIMYALRHGHADVTKALLDSGAWVSILSQDVDDILVIAVNWGCIDVVRLLMANGVGVNSTRSPGGITAVMRAAARGDHDMVKCLIEANASVSTYDTNGWNALDCALVNNQIVMVRILLHEYGMGSVRYDSSSGYTTLHRYIAANDIARVKVLVDAGIEINLVESGGATALRLAVKQGYVVMVDVLLDACACMDEVIDEWTASQCASQQGNVDLVRVISSARARVDAVCPFGWPALVLACNQGHAPVVRALLNAAAQVNVACAFDLTPLHLAAEHGFGEVVRVLIDAGADVNAQCGDGQTALHIASRNGHSDVVALLLAVDAYVDAKDEDGWTPLMFACSKRHVNIVMALLHAHSDVNATDPRGWSALLCACEINSADIVNILLNAHAEVNVLHHNDSTPHAGTATSFVSALHVASEHGHTNNTVRLLLHSEADAHMKNVNGFTALHISALNGHTHVAKLLLDACAGDYEMYNGVDYARALHLASEKGNDAVVNLLCEFSFTLLQTNSG